MTRLINKSWNSQDRPRNGTTYIDYRNHLLEARRQSYEQFDKAIFLLSGGGLTVSLPLFDRFVPLAQAQFKYYLFFSWFCFTIPLILTLFSFVFSRGSIDFQIDSAHDFYVNYCDDALKRKKLVVHHYTML